MRATAPMMHIAMNCPVVMLLLLLIFCGPVHADEWTSGDTWREAAFQSLWAIDLLQTHQIVKNETPVITYSTVGGIVYKTTSYNFEQNPLLGSNPTMGAVNRFFLAGSVLHAGISALLPAKYRPPFQYLTIVIEARTVAHNLSIGLRFGL